MTKTRKSAPQVHTNWKKQLAGIPSCDATALTMFIAYAGRVPSDKAKKVGGSSKFWEISFKEAYEELFSAVTLKEKMHVNALNTFMLNFCLISKISTFDHPDGAPDYNAYSNAGFQKESGPFIDSILPYTTKTQAKEWLEFITGAKADNYKDLFMAATTIANNVDDGTVYCLIMETICYLHTSIIGHRGHRVSISDLNFEDAISCLTTKKFRDDPLPEACNTKDFSPASLIEACIFF